MTEYIMNNRNFPHINCLCQFNLPHFKVSMIIIWSFWYNFFQSCIWTQPVMYFTFFSKHYNFQLFAYIVVAVAYHIVRVLFHWNFIPVFVYLIWELISFTLDQFIYLPIYLSWKNNSWFMWEIKIALTVIDIIYPLFFNHTTKYFFKKNVRNTLITFKYFLNG